MAAPPQAHDWRGLIGDWRVRHCRRNDAGWREFDGSARVWPVMGGLGLVEDMAWQTPAGPRRAMTVRAFDREAAFWRRWWVDGQAPREIGAPLEGKVAGDTSTMNGRMDIEGREYDVREQCTGLSAHPRWQRWTSIHGATREPDWITEFERAAGG